MLCCVVVSCHCNCFGFGFTTQLKTALFWNYFLVCVFQSEIYANLTVVEMAPHVKTATIPTCVNVLLDLKEVTAMKVVVVRRVNLFIKFIQRKVV